MSNISQGNIIKKKKIHVTRSLLKPYLRCSLQEANKKDKFCSWLPWVCCPRNTCISTLNMAIPKTGVAFLSCS